VGPLASFAPDWAGEYWGRGVRFGGCGIDGGRLYWFLVANGPAGGQDAQSAHQAALTAAAKFPAEVREAIAATPAEGVFRTDIFDRDPVTRWGAERVTLLGDAAHPMTPNLGQGACQGIEDAAALGAAVRHTGTRPAALREYERRRINRANTVVRAARTFGRVGQWSNPLATGGRNTVARLLPAAVVSRQLVRSWR
jgi:2-polyprenyl-6-methoxyphenol hydroxylase-like FAD-dependent oxidoreductase